MSSVALRELQGLWAEADSRNNVSKTEMREILGLTRVLLEAERLRSSFPVLYLYCDWAAHGQIDRNSTGRAVLDVISQAMTALADQSMRPWLPQTSAYDVLSCAFQKIGPRELRREWTLLHATKGIDGRGVNSLNGWNGIRDAIFEGLRERPISLGELDENGVPTDAKNRRLYETVLKRSRGHSMLVPIGLTIVGGMDTPGFDQHSSLLPMERQSGGGWITGVTGYCWIVQTKPRNHTAGAILPDESRSDFSYD